MRRDDDVPLSVGVIPAEPGWRVILTDGTTTYLVPVIAWSWDRFAVDEPSVEPLIIGHGHTAMTVDDVLGDMVDGFKCSGLLAPGKSLGDPDDNGWVEVATPRKEPQGDASDR